MKPEESFDKVVRNIIKDELIEQPSASFTNTVMEKMGVRKIQAQTVSEPILSVKAKLSIAAGFVIAMTLILIFSGKGPALETNYLQYLPKLQIPPVESLVKINYQVFTLIMVLICGGWLLAGLDKLLKKFFLR